jgi:hypothetical protein
MELISENTPPQKHKVDSFSELIKQEVKRQVSLELAKQKRKSKS